jgi:hypothetical protein
VQTNHRSTRIITAVGVAVVVSLAGAGCGSNGRAAVRADETTTSTSIGGSTSTTVAGEVTTTTASTPSTTVPRASDNEPMWPFRTTQEAADWQASYRAGGHQPWHLSPSETALSFAKDYLGYGDIDTATTSVTDARGAHVGVGYDLPNGDKHTAAIIHLFQMGSGSDRPWEVAGTNDGTFSLTTPVYGSVAASPIGVGGKITGVDENIKVVVHEPSSPSPVGTFCCLPAGGDNSDWHATVFYDGAHDPVLTIAASTGGHLKAVEQFTVTAVRSS